ncbi:hypothetical protein [Streptosporangium lutulentum]|uniref:Uncharacterized protein n=1 Tax=Streptosporangium lutulentum TaxID=1461250 RepID=A0ABT9QTJ3_9ACTN|nr:hypothetical protein [Streptosporangium lutulentum]MDP9850006.1 hypothetical protein [Streptosporangium lutulentum]
MKSTAGTVADAANPLLKLLITITTAAGLSGGKPVSHGPASRRYGAGPTRLVTPRRRWPLLLAFLDGESAWTRMA